MKAERDFLISILHEAGMHGRIHDTLKSLKNCNETHVGAVLRTGESFTRSSSKKRYLDQQGQMKQRNKLYERTTTLNVVIADSDEQKVDQILTSFLTLLAKGVDVDGNWVDIEVSEVDWVEAEDSILRSKIAAQFDVTLRGGIYTDTDVVAGRLGSIGANGI
jgi:hypothetical protein